MFADPDLPHLDPADLDRACRIDAHDMALPVWRDADGAVWLRRPC